MASPRRMVLTRSSNLSCVNLRYQTTKIKTKSTSAPQIETAVMPKSRRAGVSASKTPRNMSFGSRYSARAKRRRTKGRRDRVQEHYCGSKTLNHAETTQILHTCTYRIWLCITTVRLSERSSSSKILERCSLNLEVLATFANCGSAFCDSNKRGMA